jgi:hypothetical protein
MKIKKLNCYLDGNALCIVKDNFVDLQESECMFIELNNKQLREFEKLTNKEEIKGCGKIIKGAIGEELWCGIIDSILCKDCKKNEK